MDKNIGKILDERYELLELIGVGGMADIYRARDLSENRTVAVKILKNEFAGSEDFLRRFRNESKAIALLAHPNIVKIYDVGFTEKLQFIVMEFIDGITLSDYIEQQGVLKWRDAVHFSLQILRALQHAHDRGIVHRDVKASNIMLLQDGTIKVMDFGIARFNRETDKTMSEKAIGSVHYISPEQARGDITDERSDIYSVGIMMYEMLTGKKPFDGDNPVSIALMHMQSQPKRPTELNTTIPEGLEEIILKAIQKEQLKRYQTAGEMVKDIEEFKKNPSIVFEYKYFSADGTTKYFDKVNSLEESEIQSLDDEVPLDDDYDEEYDEDDEDEEERPSPIVPILFAVASALVVGVVLFVVVLLLDVFGKDNPNITSNAIVRSDGTVVMPNLIGLKYEEAKSTYKDALELIPIMEYSTKPKDEIIRQEFSVGRTLKQNDKVEVYVSSGPKQIELQDYRNRSTEEVERQLDKEGLKFTKVYREDGEVAAGYVIETNPGAYTLVDEGSLVEIIVSNGPPNTQVAMPNLVGLEEYRVHQRMEEYNLVAQIEHKNSDKPKGIAVEQSVEPGEMLAPKSVVTIFISTGVPEEKTHELDIVIPTAAKGRFKFEYINNGVIVPNSAETRDVSTKNFKHAVKGTGKITYAIDVTPVNGGETKRFYSATIDFTGETVTVSDVKVNNNAFDLPVVTTAATTVATTPEQTTAQPVDNTVTEPPKSEATQATQAPQATPEA